LKTKNKKKNIFLKKNFKGLQEMKMKMKMK